MSNKAYYEEIIKRLSSNDILNKKKNDYNRQKIMAKYEVKNGELFYKTNGQLLKILRTKNEQLTAIKIAHLMNSTECHNDYKATLSYLQKSMKYHWASVNNDVKFFIKNCDNCNNVEGRETIYQETSQIWEKVAMEILGPFFVTEVGNEYVALIVDPVSSWIEASALKSVTKEELADFVFDVFTRMGFCNCYFIELEDEMINDISSILCEKCSALNNVFHDQSFDSSLMNDFNLEEIKEKISSKTYSTNFLTDDKCNALSVNNEGVSVNKRCFSYIQGRLTYHGKTSQTISSVLGSNFVHVIEKYSQHIHNLVESFPLTWDKELKNTLFELRTSCKKNSEESPFELIFKRNPFLRLKKECRRNCTAKKDCSVTSCTESNQQKPSFPKMMEMNNINRTNEEINTPHSEEANSNDKICYDKKMPLLPTNLKRYSLRTNLKAKGNSHVVEKFLRLSSVKRSLPSVEISSNNVKSEHIKQLGEIKDKEDDILNDESVDDMDDGNNTNIINDCIENDKKTTNNTKDEPLREIHVTIVAENDLNEKELPVDENKLENTMLEEMENQVTDENEERRIMDDEISHIAKTGRGRKLEKELPYKCPKCVATYLATSDELQLHLGCHIAGQRFLQCPQCPKRVRNWSHLQRHLISHEELAHLIRIIPENRRKCSFCGKVFSTREGMLRHEHMLHRGQSRFECHICGRKYKERKTYKRHMDLHANVIHKCEHCKYKTKVKRNLIEHSRIHEGRGFQCKICKKIFTKQCILTSHMEIHNTNRHSLMCDQCGMSLANVGSLRQHIRNMHEQPGNFPCEHCDYVGKTKGNLICHIERTHNKPFKCETCAYSCKSESALKRHVDIFHNETERRFACPSCPYRARDPKHLSDHVRFRHNPNALRFPCQFCHMKFKTMTMLRHHLPAHTGQHLYSCQLCGYSAKYRQTLHHHVKAKHPDQKASSIIKGTPCSEIPCPVASNEPTDLTVERITNQDCNDYAEEVIITNEQKPKLFMTNIFTEAGKNDPSLAENLVLSTASVEEITMEGNSVTITNNGTIQLQFISGEESDENVAMKIIPTQEQTNKAVELLLLAMDPNQTVNEVVSEETVHTTE